MKVNDAIEKSLSELVETLTPQQNKFFASWLKSGNGTKAALESYDTKDPKTASVIAAENLAKLRNPMKTFLEANGIGISSLSKVLVDALEAEKADLTGDIHPDHKIRMEAVDRLSKWLDPTPKEEVPENLKRRIVAEEFFQ